MSNFWEENDGPSEYDLLEDSYEAIEEEEEEHQYYEEEDIEDHFLEEIAEEAAFDLNTKEKVVVYNARIRLEQAKLYEMLINHNLFEGVDASPQAIENVQNELKSHITDRLEILLGMKKEKKLKEQREQVVSVDSPFNDVEVEFLKALSYKGTKGGSATGQPLQNKITTGIKPLTSSAAPKLNTLANVAPKKVIQPQVIEEPVEELIQQAPVRKKKVAKKKVARKKVARKPVKKVASVKKQIKGGVGPRKLTKAEIDALAREEIAKETEITGGTNWKRLSSEEKAKRIAEENAENIRSRPSTAKDMPSQDQINAHYTMQQQTQTMSGNQHTKMNNIIATAIAAQKSKGS